MTTTAPDLAALVTGVAVPVTDSAGPVGRGAGCTVEGCDRSHEARGWCRRHYARWRRTGDVQARTTRICETPECTDRRYRRGLCRAHHQQWQRAGGGPRCDVDGCTRARRSRGLCRAHYARWQRTSHAGPGLIQGHVARDPVCTVRGCDRAHQARGLCGTHYARWRRTGDVRAATPPNPRECGIPGCQQRHHARGMCQAHYRRYKQAGGVWPTLDITECAQLYRDGASSTSLARIYGRTPRAIRTALRGAGVVIRRPGRRARGHTP